MSKLDKKAYLAKERERGRRRYLDPDKKSGRVRTKKRIEQRKLAEGICVSCTELATCARFCFYHWLVNIGGKYGLRVKNGGVETLKALWGEQNGLCALTGELLVPGQNASVDHILPRCRNGRNEKSNLQWVTKEVNYFKRTRTSSELVRMSLKVAHHAERDVRSNVLQFKKTSEGKG